jgi:hypothetical protein
VFQRRRSLARTGLALLAFLLCIAIYVVRRPVAGLETLPRALSDAEFWNLITEFSEPGGDFRSDNFVSNETTYQRVIPDLTRKLKPGGVYVGVGPDQNFTYIAALHAKLAIITDIRRQNMMLHLMYKALFEMSRSRAEFLSKLFSRPPPLTLPNNVETKLLLDVFGMEKSDPALAKEGLAAVLDQLRNRHHFALTFDDSQSIERVYNSFVAAGPEIRYSFPSQYYWRRFPSYAELIMETDGVDGGGENHSYLASEENFQAIRKMESENRIIPIVGDFAGERALRSVGRYLKEHGAAVTAFYTSNVEFYLFQSDDWKKFFNTVADLPVNTDSVFIRSYFNNYGTAYPNPSNSLQPPRPVQMIDSMRGLIDAFQAGRIRTYYDVIQRSIPN